MLSRRQFITSLTAGSAALSLCSLTGCAGKSDKNLLSVARDKSGRYSIRVFSSRNTDQFVIPIPDRAHAITVHPLGQLAVCHDRRPGRNLYIIDIASGSLTRTIKAEAGRHFYGHGTFSADGELLFTTENNFRQGTGVIGVYRTKDWQRTDELPAHGIGCHELHLHPDGETLVVANGGILTHPNQPRKKLNLDTMRPNLSYINTHTGELLDQQVFSGTQDGNSPHHQLSIRHLDINSEGTVVFGLQYQGEKSDIQPLLATHRRGQDAEFMNAVDEQWLGFSQYIASVAWIPGTRVFAASSPRGDVMTFWDSVSKQELARFPFKDAAGIAATGNQQVIASNGLGELRTWQLDARMNLREQNPLFYTNTGWDNHLTVLV